MIRILCATDLLPKSEAALDRAALLADEANASLSLVHVVEPASSELVVEQALHSAVVRMKERSRSPLWPGTVLPHVSVRVGNPTRVISDTLERQNSALLVMGPHRQRGMRDSLEETVAARMVSARRCPVLIVRAAPRAAYRTAVLALDLSRGSVGAVRAAEGLAIAPSTELVVVHAFEATHATTAVHGDAGKRAARMAVHDFLQLQSTESGRYEVVIEGGDAASVILRAVQRIQPDLLVMGTRGHGRARRALFGSVANQVMHQAKCDVLIVPEGSVVPVTQRRSPPDPAQSIRPRRSAAG